MKITVFFFESCLSSILRFFLLDVCLLILLFLSVIYSFFLISQVLFLGTFLRSFSGLIFFLSMSASFSLILTIVFFTLKGSSSFCVGGSDAFFFRGVRRFFHVLSHVAVIPSRFQGFVLWAFLPRRGSGVHCAPGCRSSLGAFAEAGLIPGAGPRRLRPSAQCQSASGAVLASPWGPCETGAPGVFRPVSSRICLSRHCSRPPPSLSRLGPTQLSSVTFTGGAAFPDAWPYPGGSVCSPRYGPKASPSSDIELRIQCCNVVLE